MYENRVKNNRNNFEIPALLYLLTRKSRVAVGKFKIIYIIFNFLALDFFVQKIKEREFRNSFHHSLHYSSIYPGTCIYNIVYIY